MLYNFITDEKMHVNDRHIVLTRNSENAINKVSQQRGILWKNINTMKLIYIE